MKKPTTVVAISLLAFVNVAQANFVTDWWGGLFKKDTVIEEGTVIKQINDNNTTVEGDSIENVVENQTTVQGDLVTNEVQAEVNNKVEIGETQVSNEVNVPDKITVAPQPFSINIENPIEIPQPLDIAVSDFKKTLLIESKVEQPMLDTLKALTDKLDAILNRFQDFNEGESARIEAAILESVSSEDPNFVAEARRVILQDLEFDTFVTTINRATVFFNNEESVELKKKSLI